MNKKYKVEYTFSLVGMAEIWGEDADHAAEQVFTMDPDDLVRASRDPPKGLPLSIAA